MANRFFPNYDNYKITSRFGMRKHPTDGVQKMHNGIDLVAAHPGGWGTTDCITAHTGGMVCGVGYNDSAGYYVRIQTAPTIRRSRNCGVSTKPIPTLSRRSRPS